MDNNYNIGFKDIDMNELESISAGSPGNLAYDLAYSIGKKLKDNYCSRKGFHISSNGNTRAGGGKRF